MLFLNTLFRKIAGQGESLLALHGWGMNHTVWSPVSEQLEQHYKVTWVDLPGHGQSQQFKADNLDEMVASLLPLINDKTDIMAWSMGGLIAQRLAYLYPDLVKSLVLIATTPAFVQSENWQHAMPESVLDKFSHNLENDYSATLKRFLSLQFMGVKNIQSQIKALRDEITASPPALDALRVGLQVLKETHLIQQQTTHKKLWLLGSMDKLVPVTVEAELMAMNSQSRVNIIESAGHAPFVSHPAVFTQHVTEFLNHA